MTEKATTPLLDRGGVAFFRLGGKKLSPALSSRRGGLSFGIPIYGMQGVEMWRVVYIVAVRVPD
jgi:hypothetical protein